MQETPPCNGKEVAIFSTVIPRTTKVDLVAPPTVMGEALACSNCNASTKAKNGQEVKHQDPFHWTITCWYYSKRRHYADECHIRHRQSEENLLVGVTVIEDGGPQPHPLVEKARLTLPPTLSSRVRGELHRAPLVALAAP